MHNLMSAVRRHKAGFAASVVLAGGMAGGVLLTPGTAFAVTATSTAVGTSTATHHFNGSWSLSVPVTVENLGGTTSPDGSVTITGGSESCTIVSLTATGTGTSGGSCVLGGLSAGTYSLAANYLGSTTNGFTGSKGNGSATFGAGPKFTAATPSLSAHNGDSYSYNFNASGDPAPALTLSGAPGWLSINNNGVVSGTVPNGINAFSYSVVATNSLGTASAGPFSVAVSHRGFPGGNGHGNGRLATSLHCTSPVHSGSQGTCTLDVTNIGGNSAQNVTGRINLPSSLRADFCGHGWGWGWGNWGCSISGNSASENLGTLRPGQSRTLTVTFTAQSTRWFWGFGHQFREFAHVTGSASSQFFWGLGFPGSFNSAYSSAFVEILPPHFWW
jgi:hypothetical protein